MTADDIKNEFAFSCDSCPETIIPIAQERFAAAWAEARAAGWRAHPVGRYEHECPACAEREARI